MSEYQNGQPKRDKRTLIAAALLLAIGAIGGRIVAGHLGYGSGASDSPQAVAAEIDRVAADPKRALGAVRLYFPTDYAAFRSQIAAMAKAGKTRREVREESFRWVRTFAVRHIDHVAAAPSEYLVRLNNAHVEMLTILRKENPQACADFGMIGIKPGSALSSSATMAAETVGARGIEAARRGIDQPTVRTTTLSDADWEALARHMLSAGATPEMLVASADLARQPVKMQCDVTFYLYKGAALMDPEDTARMSAAFQIMSKAAHSASS
jgi:hypothetical protein